MRVHPSRGFNAGLAVALALIVLGGSAALLGPGCSQLGRYEGELRERTERAEAWARERNIFRDPSEAERAARRLRWQELLARVEVVDGPAALIAHVAAQLQAPSVRALEVERRGAEALAGAAAEAELPATTFAAPDGDGSIALVSVPLDVSFRASYADALALLERIERGQVAARLDSLDIKREHPGVALRLGLTWFTRKPQEDAG